MPPACRASGHAVYSGGQSGRASGALTGATRERLAELAPCRAWLRARQAGRGFAPDAAGIAPAQCPADASSTGNVTQGARAKQAAITA